MLLIIYVQVVFQIVNILIYYQMEIVLMIPKVITIQKLLILIILAMRDVLLAVKQEQKVNIIAIPVEKIQVENFIILYIIKLVNVLVKVKNLKIQF